MGTNYYKKYNKEHIGKRSAAGQYCWDCRTTLCKMGEPYVHCGNADWFGKCPNCNKKYMEESLRDSSVGRELGFNKNEYKKKSGVKTCSSFNWSISPKKLYRNIKIVNEYKDEFSYEEFQKILLECPIQYFDSIGQIFS